MNDHLGYVVEKLSLAVRYLAIGQGDVRARLRGAFSEFHTLAGYDIPAPYDQDLRWIFERLTKHPATMPGEGLVQATLWRMKNKTAAKIAERIYMVYSLARHEYETRGMPNNLEVRDGLA